MDREREQKSIIFSRPIQGTSWALNSTSECLPPEYCKENKHRHKQPNRIQRTQKHQKEN